MPLGATGPGALGCECTFPLFIPPPHRNPPCPRLSSAVEGPGACLISLLPIPQPPAHLPAASVWPLSSVLAPWRGGRLGDVARFLGEQGVLLCLDSWSCGGLGPYTVAWPGAGRSDQRAWRSGLPTLPGRLSVCLWLCPLRRSFDFAAAYVCLCARFPPSSTNDLLSLSLPRRCLHFLLLCFQVQVRGLLTLTFPLHPPAPASRYASVPFPRAAPPPWAPPLLGVERCTCSQGAEGRLRVRPARAGNRPRARGSVAGLRPARPQSASAGSGPLERRAQSPQCAGLRAPRPRRGVRTEGFSLPTVSSPSPLALPNKKAPFNRVDSESREKASVVNYPVVSEAFAALREIWS